MSFMDLKSKKFKHVPRVICRQELDLVVIHGHNVHKSTKYATVTDDNDNKDTLR